MKRIILIFSAFVLFSFTGCNQGGGANGKDSLGVDLASMTFLKTTKEFKTRLDGTVDSLNVKVEIGYNEKQVVFRFAEDSTKNLTLKVDSMLKDSSGIRLILDDRKYQEVFITSGKVPQIHLSTVKGTETSAFM